MFSIVITTYNRSKLLKRCLDSIKNQTFNQYEVLIALNSRCF
ncbi:glycosyltransferase family 2 protein [Campylobacter fetus]|nr:glycosyltransferase [Campylobacter fetus]